MSALLALADADGSKPENNNNNERQPWPRRRGRPMTARAPVVILGVNEMALAAARTLNGRHAIRVIGVHTGGGPCAPAAHSRHLELRQGPEPKDETALLAFLERLAEELAAEAVLLPAQDSAVLFLHRHRRELAGRYRFFVWESDVLLELGSKRGLAAVAARYALPVPETMTPHSRAELETAIGRLEFPQLVKPEFTQDWWSEPAVQLGLGHKAIAANDATELRDVYERSAHVGARVVIQRIIGGRDCDHWSYAAFVAPSGVTTAEILVRKLRVNPPTFGIGSYVVTAADEDVLRVGREVLRTLDFRGFASVQMKRDGAGGRPYLIEVNLRLPTWVELAIAAGVDFPRSYYQTCIGESYASPTASNGRCWMSLGRDWRSMRTYARVGEWTWYQWLAQCLARPARAVFRWDDPLPAVIATWRWLRSSFARRVNAARTPRPAGSHLLNESR
jgi:predicted ATP-grasp superfamily ATP-dependent carboligase